MPRALGWPGESLDPYAPGKCIGGSRFGNYEGLLPEADGRTYTECDIDTLGADSRGAKRIVFSNDGLIYQPPPPPLLFDLLLGGGGGGGLFFFWLRPLRGGGGPPPPPSRRGCVFPRGTAAISMPCTTA